MTANEINPNDVLCGRGGLTNSHTGNKMFRNVVAEYQLEYLKARKNDKKDIARRIVARIQENGGRFLQRRPSSSLWSIAPEKRAVEKTSQALREGLDVRHKTLRTRKLVRNRNRSHMTSSLNRNITKGIVADSSRLNRDLQENIPELVNDESPVESFEPIFSFFPQTTGAMISEKDCDTVLQV